MSVGLIRKALEKRLSTVTPAMSTAFENISFTPVTGVPWQRINLLPNTPQDGQIGSGLYFERGIFQVMLCYPMGLGPSAAESRAQLVKDTFKRGTSMIEGGVTVIVMNAPSVAGAMIEGDSYCIPVSIRYQAQVQTP